MVNRQPDDRRTLIFYRVAVAVLLAVVCALSWVVQSMDRDHALLEAKLRTRRGVGPRQAPIRRPQRLRSVIDLSELVTTLALKDPDAADLSLTLFSTPFASVHLHVIGVGQSCPLHIYQVTHEATAIITGNPRVLQIHGTGGKAARMERIHAPGEIIASPPFSGHKWVNSSGNQQANLVLASPPFDGNRYLDADDPRLLQGPPPQLYDPDVELKALAAQGVPFRLQRTRMLQGKIWSLTVAKEARISPAYGPTIIYIAKGEGALMSDKRHPIRAQLLALVSSGEPFTISAKSGSPVAAVLFRPRADGTSDILRKGRKLYSQQNEELIIREFFQDRRGGIFLDVGSGHYKRDSTTFYLEQHLGWSGVAVDALAEYRADYVKHRPKTRFVSYLVTDKSRGERPFYRSKGWVEVSSASKQVTQQQARAVGDDSVTELKVQSITLNELLGQLKVEKIDLLSMDIEEHEPAALAGFDIERYRPELVCIEAHASVRRVLLRYFTSHGYIRIDKYLPYDPNNWYFRPKNRR